MIKKDNCLSLFGLSKLYIDYFMGNNHTSIIFIYSYLKYCWYQLNSLESNDGSMNIGKSF